MTLNELDRRTLGELEALYGPRRRPAPVVPIAPKPVAPARARRGRRLRMLVVLALLVCAGLVAADPQHAGGAFAWVRDGDILGSLWESQLVIFVRELVGPLIRR